MKIYLDFDGTVVEHQFPDLGKYNEGCFEVIRKLQAAGHEVVLNTYRANIDLEYVQEALDYLNADLSKHPITKFENKKIAPLPWDLKVFKEKNFLFIDDICDGIPLLPSDTAEFDKVDWASVDEQLESNGIYIVG